jgi:hypothetical protein
VAVVIINALLATVLMYLLIKRVRRDQEKRPGRRDQE